MLQSFFRRDQMFGKNSNNFKKAVEERGTGRGWLGGSLGRTCCWSAWLGSVNPAALWGNVEQKAEVLWRQMTLTPVHMASSTSQASAPGPWWEGFARFPTLIRQSYSCKVIPGVRWLTLARGKQQATWWSGNQFQDHLFIYLAIVCVSNTLDTCNCIPSRGLLDKIIPFCHPWHFGYCLMAIVQNSGFYSQGTFLKIQADSGFMSVRMDIIPYQVASKCL